MSEFQSSIERKNVRVSHEIGTHAVLFSYADTVLYEHYEPFEMFDHIYRRNGDGQNGTVILRDTLPDLYQKLIDNNFPTVVAPYPTEADERMVLQIFDAQLDVALEEIIEDGE